MDASLAYQLARRILKQEYAVDPDCTKSSNFGHQGMRLTANEVRQIETNNQLFILLSNDDSKKVKIKSDELNIYDPSGNNISDHSEVHKGNITITNTTNTAIYIEFLKVQVVDKN